MIKKDYHKNMIIYAATGNEHKRQELSQLFAPHTIIIPKDKGIDFDPEENGNSFVENTIIKATGRGNQSRNFWQCYEYGGISKDMQNL